MGWGGWDVPRRGVSGFVHDGKVAGAMVRQGRNTLWGFGQAGGEDGKTQKVSSSARRNSCN